VERDDLGRALGEDAGLVRADRGHAELVRIHPVLDRGVDQVGGGGERRTSESEAEGGEEGGGSRGASMHGTSFVEVCLLGTDRRCRAGGRHVNGGSRDMNDRSRVLRSTEQISFKFRPERRGRRSGWLHAPCCTTLTSRER
jgi:hypothetical protein